METQNQSTSLKDVYQIVTNQILAQLEKGIIPWKKTWTDAGLPQNLISRKPYGGLNVWLLTSLGYSQNFFLTFHQLQEIGGKVKKDEKPHVVVFYKWMEVENKKSGERERKPFLRYYRVYNISQVEIIGEINIPQITKPNNPVAECEFILKTMPNPPLIVSRNNDAYYHYEGDYINIPSIDRFESSESFYETLFHELVHSTGHKSRLNRKEIVERAKFGSEKYSIEELTAECGACYLKSIAGFNDSVGDNSTAYIQSWYAALSKNPRMILYAGSQAQKGVDYILSNSHHE